MNQLPQAIYACPSFKEMDGSVAAAYCGMLSVTQRSGY